MIRPIAFCAGLALAWCGTAEAADFNDDVIRYLCLNVPRSNVSCRDALQQISRDPPTVEAQSLPNPAITPGAVYYTDKMQACSFDRSTPRLSGEAYRETAQYVFELYGIPYSEHRNYELDHLIPRCLGGADTVANLWPQPLPEAKVKDHRWEDTICRAVCHADTMSIEDGQAFFRDLKWIDQ